MHRHSTKETGWSTKPEGGRLGRLWTRCSWNSWCFQGKVWLCQRGSKNSLERMGPGPWNVSRPDTSCNQLRLLRGSSPVQGLQMDKHCTNQVLSGCVKKMRVSPKGMAELDPQTSPREALVSPFGLSLFQKGSWMQHLICQSKIWHRFLPTNYRYMLQVFQF